jgi:microcystin degradation protein MlrC
MRSRAFAADFDNEAKLSAEFCSADALAAIDRRAASNEPWWITPDSSDDEGGAALVDHQTAKAELGATINHAGYVLSSLLLGTRAPLPIAAVVVGLLGAMYLPPFRVKDGDDDYEEEETGEQ